MGQKFIRHSVVRAFAEQANTNLRLRNAIVVVSDGTSTLGKTIVQGFLDEGAIVAYSGPTVSESGSEFAHPRAAGKQVDSRDKEAVEKWIAETAQEYGRIDILVSAVSSTTLVNSLERWLTAQKTDIESVIDLVNASLPHLRKSRRSPNIVLVSTVSGREAYATASSIYDPFRPALRRYAQALIRDIGPAGIRVEIVTPIATSDGRFEVVVENQVLGSEKEKETVQRELMHARLFLNSLLFTA